MNIQYANSLYEFNLDSRGNLSANDVTDLSKMLKIFTGTSFWFTRQKKRTMASLCVTYVVLSLDLKTSCPSTE